MSFLESIKIPPLFQFLLTATPIIAPLCSYCLYTRNIKHYPSFLKQHGHSAPNSLSLPLTYAHHSSDHIL